MSCASKILLSFILLMTTIGCVEEVSQRPPKAGPNVPDMTTDMLVDALSDLSGDASHPDGSMDETPELCDPDVLENICLESTCAGPVLFSDAVSGSRFGESVAIHDDWMVVGAPGTQSVFVYQLNSSRSAWERKHTLDKGWLADSVQEVGPDFGVKVAISDTWVAISEVPDSRGSSNSKNVYFISIETLKQDASDISETLRVIEPPIDAQRFGASLALNGDQLFVGHVRNCEGSECGSVKSYTLTDDSTPLNTGVTNTLAGEFGAFGADIALRGDVVFGSSPEADAFNPSMEKANKAGFVTAFYPNNLAETIQSSAPKRDDEFGASIAVGEGFLAVGAPVKEDDPDEDAGPPRVEFFVFGEGMSTDFKYLHSGPENSRMGASVSAHGSLAVAGAYSENLGSITLFSNILCSQFATRVFDAPVLKSQASDVMLSQYGYAVAVSDKWIAVGAPGTQNDRGAVHLIPLK